MADSPVLIVDDHDVFRGGLKLLLRDRLGVADVIEARSLGEALATDTGGRSPMLITLDLSMPDVVGTEALNSLKSRWPDAPIVVVSASEDRNDILACLSAGAHGFAPKGLSADELTAALQQVLDGRIYAPKLLLKSYSAPTAVVDQAALGLSQLTSRQRQVLDSLLTGASTKQIGRELDLAEGTVKVHLAAIYRAVGVRSRAEAIARLRQRWPPAESAGRPWRA